MPMPGSASAPSLERDGWTVTEAADGREALDRVRARAAATDPAGLTMPLMDGFAFLHELRLRPGCADIPVVVLTARDLDAADRSAWKARTGCSARARPTCASCRARLRALAPHAAPSEPAPAGPAGTGEGAGRAGGIARQRHRGVAAPGRDAARHAAPATIRLRPRRPNRAWPGQPHRRGGVVGRRRGGVRLVGARLAGASLRGADLSHADLSGADFSGSMRGRGADGGRPRKRGAASAELVGGKLAQVDAGQAVFSDALLEDAEFREAGLQFADFSGAVLDGADFSGADLWGASMGGVATKRTVFQGARLDEGGSLPPISPTPIFPTPRCGAPTCPAPAWPARCCATRCWTGPICRAPTSPARCCRMSR